MQNLKVHKHFNFRGWAEIDRSGNHPIAGDVTKRLQQCEGQLILIIGAQLMNVRLKLTV